MDNEKMDSKETQNELYGEIISANKIEMLVREAAINKPIPIDIAMDIAKLIFTTAALSEGEASINVKFKIHDTKESEGQLRKHGLHGFCLACIKIESKFGHVCASIAPGEMTRCCLLPFTKIKLGFGGSKEIKDLQIGDIVLAFDQLSGQSINTKISCIIKHHLRDHYYKLNDELFITNDHPILTIKNGMPIWTKVEELLVGDLVKLQFGVVIISNLEKINEEVETVYMETENGNFIIDANDHPYIVKSNYVQFEFKEIHHSCWIENCQL